ncbi:hypothetical protein A2U01_0109082, partial [Trifolium medium]|nr:hypothetical protein [Trifolium medium]
MPNRCSSKPKMGDKVDALETQMVNVTSTLDELSRQMANHAQ